VPQDSTGAARSHLLPEEREVVDKQVALTQKRGIWKKPAHSPG
jgi:hypothetical protein